MTAAVTPNNASIPTSELAANMILSASFHATNGAITAHFFTSLHPMGGAIFGLTHVISVAVGKNLLNSVFGDSSAEKTVKFAFRFFGSILVALSVTSLAGYALTLSSSAYLALAMIPTAIITGIGLHCLRQAAGV